MMKRDRTIDILKGIGILLVVYAHAIAGRICFVKYIFSFHMGLFFFAAGYLLKGKTDMPFGKFLLKKFKAFFVPYIVFFLFAMLVTQSHPLINSLFVSYSTHEIARIRVADWALIRRQFSFADITANGASPFF